MTTYHFDPQPKVKRIVDAKAIERVRVYAHGICEYCGCACIVHVHHIKSKGSGGHDIEENLIALCTFCHDKAHKVRITKIVLLEIAEARAMEIRDRYGHMSMRELRKAG